MANSLSNITEHIQFYSSFNCQSNQIETLGCHQVFSFNRVDVMSNLMWIPGCADYANTSLNLNVPPACYNFYPNGSIIRVEDNHLFPDNNETMVDNVLNLNQRIVDYIADANKKKNPNGASTFSSNNVTSSTENLNRLKEED
ncbi:hypothetical protein HDU92_008078 [Lobulomyces angularis]|nr:hypothetical protein HDU92_008078 [Lobulomyces angularis]